MRSRRRPSASERPPERRPASLDGYAAPLGETHDDVVMPALSRLVVTSL